MVGLENYLVQMIMKRRQHVLCKNEVVTSKIKFTVRAYTLCIGLNESYLCWAHYFVVGPASEMMQYRDLVFHLFVRSHGHISFLVFFIYLLITTNIFNIYKGPLIIIYCLKPKIQLCLHVCYFITEKGLKIFILRCK